MYFSKNSRYVFRSAQCMPPASYFLDCLKLTKKNLCIKSPKEDPTKPPLRLNIPDDSGGKQSDIYSAPGTNHAESRINRKEGSAPRSKSVLSKSKKNPISFNFDDDLNATVPKCESEIQFSTLKNRQERDDPGSDHFQVKSGRSEYQIADGRGERENSGEGLITLLDDNYFRDSSRRNQFLSKPEIGGSQKNPDGQVELEPGAKYDNSEPKALYIIIDVPDKQNVDNDVSHTGKVRATEEESSRPLKKMDGDSVKAEKASKTAEVSTSADNFTTGLPKSRSKSLPKISTRTTRIKSSPKIKFQVHEIDEAATYIFHVRFNKSLRDKHVGQVPEKELNTRKQGLTDGETQILNETETENEMAAKGYRGLGREIATIDDPLELITYESDANPENRFERIKKEILSRPKSAKNSKPAEGKSKMSASQDDPRPPPPPPFPPPPPSTPRPSGPPKEESTERSKSGAEETSQSEYFTYPLTNRKIAPHAATGNAKTDKSNQSSASDCQETEEVSSQKRFQPVEGPLENSNPKAESSADKVKNYYNGQYRVREDGQQGHADKESMGHESSENNMQRYYVQEIQRESNPDENESAVQHESKGSRQQSAAADDGNPTDGKQEVTDRGRSLSQANPETDRNPAGRESATRQRSGERRKHGQKGTKIDRTSRKGVKFSTSTEGSTRSGKGSDFQTAGSVLKISSESSACPMRFCPAYPPILNMSKKTGSELMLTKKESMFHASMNKIGFRTREYEPKTVKDLSENSILFPAGENDKFDCASLFDCRQGETAVDRLEKSGEKSAKKKENSTECESSVDSMTVMKKVKEIVDFDLNNAVKIFEGREDDSRKETVSSVLVRAEDGWRVDVGELEKCVSGRRKEIDLTPSDNRDDPSADDRLKKIDRVFPVPKYFPGRKNGDGIVKVNDGASRSVVTFDQAKNRFDVNAEDLQEAIRRSRENFALLHSESVMPTAEIFPAEVSVLGYGDKFAKNGDSILIYDELTQTWKVDYSILEKREEQMRHEEELTKRSELILETFEKLERGNVSNVPKPNSREKKIFDYNSEEWKAYKPNDKSTTKSKQPFKESDAEEIRKKNSDLYENLFVVNKKETKVNVAEGKEAPGPNRPDPKKGAQDNKPIVMANSKEAGTKEPETTSKNPMPPLKETDRPTSKKEINRPVKEDEDYWGNFLRTNILPFDRPEKKKQPPPSPTPPASKKEGPKIKMPPSFPQKKIDEPKFKIPIPFGWDKKIETPVKKPPPPKGIVKKESPAVKVPPPATPPTGIQKKDPPSVKAPPPATPPTGIQKKDPPTVKAPPPATPTGTQIKDIPSVKAPPPVTPPTGIKIKDIPPVKEPPPAAPPTGTQIKDIPSVKAPPPAAPPTGIKIKDIPSVKTPPPATSPTRIKIKDIPSVKAPPPTAPPTGTQIKDIPPVKAPPPATPPTGTQIKDIPPVKAPPPAGPSTGTQKKDEPSAKPPPPAAPATETQKKEEPLAKPPPPATPLTETQKKEEPLAKPPPPTTPLTETQKKEEPSLKAPPSATTPPTGTQSKDTPEVKTPAPASEKKHAPAPSDPLPSKSGQVQENPVIKESPPSEKSSTKIAPSSTPTNEPETTPPQTRVDPKKKSPPLIGSPKEGGPAVKASQKSTGGDTVECSKMKADGKKEKNHADHYVSDNIIEMSKNATKDVGSKTKSNKIETVKLNIKSESRAPSKITEINLNKKFEDLSKERSVTSEKEIRNDTGDFPKGKREDFATESRTFYKNFDKYKTPFGDPEYEEKSVKINSDMDSNPNLKKLDNWNKTLVLHDIVKSPENIETWLKDETDKMATLLLKVLQEAADGKPKKKPGPIAGKQSEGRIPAKSNPYDSIRKKQETNSPEGFLLKVKSVNLTLDGDKATKSAAESSAKNVTIQTGKPQKSSSVVDGEKAKPEKEIYRQTTAETGNDRENQTQFAYGKTKPKLTEFALEPIESNFTREVAKNGTELTDQIPGPEILKRISSTWKLFPVIGCQMTIFTLLRIFQLVNLGSTLFNSGRAWKSRTHVFNKLFSKYGPIVNLQGPLSGNVILIHKPEHLSAVFEQDSMSAVRSVFDSVDRSRKDAEHRMAATGVPVDWSKPEWNNLKKASWLPLGKGCETYFENVEIAADSLVNNVRRNKNGQNFGSEDFMEEIKRWSLEGLCSVLFARSFGFLENRSSNLNWLLEPDKLYLAVEEASDCMSKCESGFQIWRLITTPSLIGLGQAYRSLSGIISKQLYQAEMNLKNKSELVNSSAGNSSHGGLELTYIENMLLFDGMKMEEITCNLVDVLLIGSNAMSSALGFLLYQLAQNVKVQDKLLNEIKEILPEKTSRLKYQKLVSLKYLQACLKESLRLNTPFPLFFRLLQSDILLSNYVIPKGTYVVMDSRVTCMKEQIFEEPEKFMPERWLKDEKWIQNAHPFSSFPLCHGPRSDLAKRILEMQLCSCVAKVVRNFELEYHFGEISGTESIISFPDKPLKLNFVERSH